MTIIKTEKDGTQPIIVYVVYLMMVDLDFSKNTEVFVMIFAKLKCQILLQGIFEITNITYICMYIYIYIYIYNAVTIEKLEKKEVP